jgi:hypothetical protein
MTFIIIPIIFIVMTPQCIDGIERDGVMGGWRKLHNEDLHDLYSSLSKTRKIKNNQDKKMG